MISKSFSDINHWVFDLDNTLYPPEARLFDQIEIKMTEWVSQKLSISAQQANILREKYWKNYGTTLAGLMREHHIKPDDYLAYVHDISFDSLENDPILKRLIEALPGRKIVYTNGTAPYAKNVLQALGLESVFDHVYGVENANYFPKPEERAYKIIFEKDQLVPFKSAMFEDEPRNLRVPYLLGMKTVFVSPKIQKKSFINFQTKSLSGFLKQLIT